MKFSLKSKGDYQQWWISVDEYPFFFVQAWKLREAYFKLMSQRLWIRELRFFTAMLGGGAAHHIMQTDVKDYENFIRTKYSSKQEDAYEVIEIPKVSTQLLTHSGVWPYHMNLLSAVLKLEPKY